ncbi:hypothetical protein LJY25_08290 [Hymenobacter sp. BT175]|uniref:hypothetical protein n=1 Tax=Hymenobacter translucens TaxID=2886507 RepID=UPI001D0E369A|nr:hypothetical protein [Hymenobacter translucens]MCC2546441.1 hypothetical protein [Hymenobacter translucens]
MKQQLQPQLRRRIVKGVEETYLVTPKPISDGAQSTARVLHRMALQAVEEARAVPFLLTTTATDAEPTPPPVAVNNETLAKIRKVSGRTIRQHLRELMSIGFIVKRRFRGTKANFELWISTKFLWKTDSQALNSQSSENRTKAGEAAFVEPTSTKLPLIQSLVKQDTSEIEIAHVDKLVTNPEQATLTGNTGPRHTQEARPTAPKQPRQAKQTEKESKGAGGAAARPAAANPALEALRREMVTQTFHYAWKLIYPERSFSEHEQRKSLEAIRAGVYRNFEAALTEAQWNQYHDEVFQRIDLAAAYFRRHTNKFAPSPFAEFVAGTGYFDAENAQGFEGTHRWLANHLANQYQRDLSKALLRARREMRAYRLKTAPKRVLAMTATQLYRYHETKLRKFGKAGLERFYAQVGAPKS